MMRRFLWLMIIGMFCCVAACGNPPQINEKDTTEVRYGGEASNQDTTHGEHTQTDPENQAGQEQASGESRGTPDASSPDVGSPDTNAPEPNSQDAGSQDMHSFEKPNAKESRGCTGDTDCQKGQICEQKRCIPGCRGSQDCTNGLRCEPTKKKCVTCLKNSDCKNGQICKNNQCHGCKIDPDCPKGHLCLKGACIKGNCRSSADCTKQGKPGQVCKKQLCSPCQIDGDCTAPKRCFGGVCKQPPPPKLGATFLWQGFHHEWLRRVVGFQTPHRVGGLANYLTSESHNLKSNSWNGQATAQFIFTPGVDGDFAKPELHYSGIIAPGLHVHHQEESFQFTDTSIGTKYPKAETTLTRTLDINLNTAALGFGKLANYVVVLRGLRTKSTCVQAKQPAGEKCNSNGMWPHKFSFAIEGCKKNKLRLQCTCKLEIFRSYTPHKGGGKPYNSRLDFAVGVPYTVLGGEAKHLRATYGPLHKKSSMLRQGRVSGIGSMTGASGYALANVGVTAFGFQLLKTKNNDHLGRYLTTLSFGVRAGAYTQSNGKLNYGYWMGVKAPKTVVDSTTISWIRPVLLQFGSGARQLNAKKATGQICFSGFGFSCKAKKLKESTTHQTKLVHSLTW